ncbi:MAG: general stress protein [Prochloraceae cyanobacterium]
MTYRHAIGTFATYEQAQFALQELSNAGFNMDKVSIITQNPEETSTNGARVKPASEQAKGGAGAGATAGAATGGILGLFGGLGALFIPGVGPIAELGIVLANTLLGSGIGAAGGSLVGALIGWGIPEDRANYYNDLLSQGNYLILVEGTEAEINLAESVLQKRSVNDWSVYGAPTAHPTTGMGRI